MIKARLELRPGWDQYDLHIFEKRRDELFVAKPVGIEMVKIVRPRSGILPDLVPFLRIDGIHANELLPALADALALHGFKPPTDEDELKSVLKATQFHLEDMRKLVSKLTKPCLHLKEKE